MQVSELKSGFISYLQVLSANNGKEYITESANMSIFLYANEFRDYVGNIPEFYSMSVNDIVKAVKNNTEIDEGTVDAQEDVDESEQDKSLLSDIVADLLNDDKFVSAIDTDLNNSITDSEIENFLNYVKDFDEDGSSISIDDIIEALSQIEDGTFVIPSVDDNVISSDDINEIESEKITQTDNSAPVRNSSSGGSRTANVGAVNNANQKNYDSMSRPELEQELQTANNDLKEKTNRLNSIKNGDDPALVSFKESVEEKYQAYINAAETVDKNLANKLDNAQKAIDEQESKVAMAETNIQQCKNEVQITTNSYNTAVANENELKNSLEELKSAQQSETSDEGQARLANKISIVEAAYDKAKIQTEKAEAAKNKAEQELKNAESNKEALLNGESGLNKLNNNKSIIESQLIAKNPDLAELKQEYETAKTDLENKKNKLITEVQNEIDITIDNINQINNAILNIDTDMKAARKNSLNGTVSGDDIMSLAKFFKGKNAEEMHQIMNNPQAYFNDESNNVPDEIKKLLYNLDTTGSYRYDAGNWCADFTSFILGLTVGEENLPDWYKNTNRAYCPSIMKAGKGSSESLSNFKDAQPGDLVMLGLNGTGGEHAALFLGWADDSHTWYYTVERCGENGYDGVGTLKRNINWTDIGGIFRMNGNY